MGVDKGTAAGMGGVGAAGVDMGTGACTGTGTETGVEGLKTKAAASRSTAARASLGTTRKGRIGHDGGEDAEGRP